MLLEVREKIRGSTRKKVLEVGRKEGTRFEVRGKGEEGFLEVKAVGTRTRTRTREEQASEERNRLDKRWRKKRISQARGRVDEEKERAWHANESGCLREEEGERSPVSHVSF